MSRRVLLDGKLFPSITSAAAFARCDKSTMARAIKKGGQVWVNSLGKYVMPKAVAVNLPTEERVVTDLVSLRCPCCGEYFDVEVCLR